MTWGRRRTILIEGRRSTREGGSLADDQQSEELDRADTPLEDVKERVQRIQRQHRGGIRWRISKHTAELAIRALETGQEPRCGARPSGKSRRRKRFKRLL